MRTRRGRQNSRAGPAGSAIEVQEVEEAGQLSTSFEALADGSSVRGPSRIARRFERHSWWRRARSVWLNPRIKRSVWITLVAVATVLVSVAAVKAGSIDPSRAITLGAEADAVLNVEHALTTPPGVAMTCPPPQNCLNSLVIPAYLRASVQRSFPGIRLDSSSSIFDARIPEVDQLQISGTTVHATSLQFTLLRLRDSPSVGHQLRRTKVRGGRLMIAAQRDIWIVSIVASRSPDAATVDAAQEWVENVVLPR